MKRYVVWSDPHPDTSPTVALQCQFLEDVVAASDGAVCLGDIVRLWDGTRGEAEKNSGFLRWVDGVRAAARKTRIAITDSNHTPLFKDKDSAWFRSLFDGAGVEFVDSLDGSWLDPSLRSLRLEHGHRLDPFNHVWDTLLSLGNATIGERLTVQVSRWLGRVFWNPQTPGDIKLQARNEGCAEVLARQTDMRYHAAVRIVDDAYRSWLVNSDVSGVVCGHTHYAESCLLYGSGDRAYYNVGAWDDPGNCTYMELVVDGGFVGQGIRYFRGRG